MNENEIDPVDREALERAIEMARQESPGRREQIDDKLADEPWEKVARFAAYCCQCDTLRLKPWQSPPCWVDDMEAILAAGDDGIRGQYAAAKLLMKMLDAGLSEWEPDPVAALAKARTLPLASVALQCPHSNAPSSH